MNHLSMFYSNLLSSSFVAVALFLMGSMFVAKGQSLHALVLGQAANFGISLGLVLAIFLGVSNLETEHVSTVVSLIFSGVVFGLLQKSESKTKFKETPFLISIFLILLSINFILIAVFPGLETHSTNALMGDLATASRGASYEILGISFVFILFWVFKRQSLMRSIFWQKTTDLPIKKDLLMILLSGVLFIESIRHLGFLFTLGAVVIPVFFASISAVGMKSFYKVGVLIALVGTFAGFVASLMILDLPTTATVIVSMSLMGFLFLARKIRSHAL